MLLSQLTANIPRHLPPSPPPFSGGPPPLPLSEKPGPCGLTSHQWHMVLTFVLLLLFALSIALVISRLNDSEISLIWLEVQDRAKLTRMGLRERLFGHLLSEDDIRSGRIVTGPEIAPRRYPIIDFIIGQLRRAPSPNANAT